MYMVVHFLIHTPTHTPHIHSINLWFISTSSSIQISHANETQDKRYDTNRKEQQNVFSITPY